MSANYSKVQSYYKKGLWSLEKVKLAVGRWITEEEYTLITGEEYTE